MSQPWLTRTPHDQAVMEVLQEIRSFTDAMDRMHGEMKGDMEMNATDLAALRMLIVREGRDETVSPHQVAEHLRISTASTTKLLDRLTASGHIERLPHPSDGRGRIVLLTDLSRETFLRHFSERLGQMRGVADHYDDEELGVITRFLSEMSEALDPR